MAGTDARPLPPGEYRLYQLVGLEAVTETGESLGRVTDILETGANDVFVVTPAGGGQDLLLPYHEDVIREIRPEEGRMTVRPLRYYDEEPVVLEDVEERRPETPGADRPG